MAQYKVPQDVEADDKLLGPFSFRQFVYLLIAGALIAVGVGLFQIFPILAIIPLPFVLLFGALALPLRKDQPMETYLAAVASYYLKPRNRMWVPGQKESTIEITAPKIVDDGRARDITGEEATHRLSFLADIVDTEGYAIKGVGPNHVSAELVAEATQAYDMFGTTGTSNLEDAIARDADERHAEVVRGMKEEIEKTENISVSGGITKRFEETTESQESAVENSSEREKPTEEKRPTEEKSMEEFAGETAEEENKVETKPTNPSIMELANNNEYSVATIAKEANRIKEREEGEVFISLH